ncbi:MAG TPA: hypothetical protein EYP35_01405 [Desulfobacterales bacterium]|nr:hypothetical protein [Desulfobacterales bacterium]HIP40550.1 hypothetical protein [Desulfocapsa sulfexigens]
MLKAFRPFYLLITLLFLMLLAGGCSKTPVRHLVSDACMVSVGHTTRKEVLKLMGDPDAKRMINPTTEEWVYYEEARSSLQDAPLVGDMFDPDGYQMLVMTLSGDIVKTCRYSGFEADEFKWKDDYSWQEIKK